MVSYRENKAVCIGEGMSTCFLCRGTAFSSIKRTFGNKHIGRCNKCGLVQICPAVTNREYAAFYADDWNHFAPYLSQIQAHRRYFQHVLQYVTHCVKQPVKSLLDVGCAVGVLLEEAHKFGIAAEGVDISKAAVSYAKKQHLRVFHDTCVSWEKRGGHAKQYDVITALEVVEHEKNPLTMLRAMFRMLRPGGMAVLTTPNFNTVFRTLMEKNWIGYQHREHLWFFTPETMTRLLKQAGFSDIRVHPDFYRPYSVSFMFERLGDYVPVLRPVTKIFSGITKGITLTIPFNPWGDMLVTAKPQKS